jgi:hypothetical protein
MRHGQKIVRPGYAGFTLQGNYAKQTTRTFIYNAGLNITLNTPLLSKKILPVCGCRTKEMCPVSRRIHQSFLNLHPGAYWLLSDDDAPVFYTDLIIISYR